MTRAALVVVVLVVCALSGCAETTPGEPVPLPGNGVPQVGDPLDASAYLTDPCAALSRDQLADLGIDRAGTTDPDSAIARHIGPSCVWHARMEVHSSIMVAFPSETTPGLRGLYLLRFQMAYFEETTVEGYPAVFYDLVDHRNSGTCGIEVGLSNDLTALVGETGGSGARACARAKVIARAVINTLRGNS